jgi:hypothetical protein
MVYTKTTGKIGVMDIPPNPKKKTPSQSKNDPNVILGKVAKDVAALKVSVLKLAKLFEDEKKSAAIARQKQRAEDYAAKYKRATPTKADRSAVKENKKSLLDMLKEALSNIFTFIIAGLAAIGLSKLLSVSGVMDTITEFTKRLIIGISELLQKGMNFISSIIKDPQVIQTIFDLAKTILQFIGDAITAGAKFFSKFVSDAGNQKIIGDIIVAIISGIASAIKAAYSITKNILSENSDAIKEGAMSVFLVIKDIIVGTLKAGQSILGSAELKEQFVYIGNAIMNFIGQVMNMPIFEVNGTKVTLKQALIGLAVATTVMQAGMYYVIGALQGLGMKAAGIKSGRGGGSKDGKPETGKDVPGGKGKKSRMPSFNTIVGAGATAFAAYEIYDLMKPEKTDRSTEPSDSTFSSSSTSPKPSGASTKSGSQQNQSPNQNYSFDAMKTKVQKMLGLDTFGEGSKLSDSELKRRANEFGFQHGRTVKYTDTNGHQASFVHSVHAALVDPNLPIPEAGVNVRDPKAIQKNIDFFKKQDQNNPETLFKIALYKEMKKDAEQYQRVKNLIPSSASGDTSSKSPSNLQPGMKGTRFDPNVKAMQDKMLSRDSETSQGYGGNALQSMAAASTPSMSSMSSMSSMDKMLESITGMTGQKDKEGHEYASGGSAESGASATSAMGGVEKPKSIMESFADSLGEGLASFDKATGGKLGFASTELQTLLRDKSFLEAFETPVFADSSKNVQSTDNTALNEKTPSVYDEVLLSKMMRA